MAEPLPGSARLDDIPYRYRVVRSKRGVSLLTIGLELPGQARFLLRREGATDRLAKRFGLAHEWQTGEDPLDERVYIQSDDTRLHELLSLDNRLRTALLELFRSPQARSLELARGVLRMRVSYDAHQHGRGTPEAIIARAARNVVPALDRVRQRLRALGSEQWDSRRDPGLVRYQLFVGAAALMAALGFASLFLRPGAELPRALLHDEVHALAWRAALLVAVGGVALVMSLLGRSSRTHRALAAVLLLAAPGAWFAALSYYERANIAGASAGSIFETRIVSKHRERAKGGDRYLVTLQSLPDARMSPRLRLSPERWQLLEEGQCVRLTLHQGALGDPVLTDTVPLRCGE